MKIYDIFISKFVLLIKDGKKEMFYLMMHSAHFIYAYMASGIW